MGTLVRIVLYARTQRDGDAAAAAAFARIAALDARLSDYREDSELTALSRAAVGVPVPLSDDLFAILSASETLARRTDGAFDITAGRLTHLWRSARRLNAWPEAARVAAARAAGGFANVRLDPRRRTATLAQAGIALDPGGIAKGYAVDEALRVLQARGIGAALVGLGGDLAAGDPPPGRTGWTVAIPRLAVSGATAEPFWIELAHAAVSTSGDAEQWMTADGVRRSHVIDLRSGWPVTGRTATQRRGAPRHRRRRAEHRARHPRSRGGRRPPAPSRSRWSRPGAVAAAARRRHRRRPCHRAVAGHPGPCRHHRPRDSMRHASPRSLHRWLPAVALLAAALAAPQLIDRVQAAADNVLTAEETAAGWQLLFDGTTIDKWRVNNGTGMPADWSVVDGAITAAKGPARASTSSASTSSATSSSRLDFKVAKNGNSGIFYRGVEAKSAPIYHSAPEYQVIDNDGHPDAKNGPDRFCGANYDARPAARPRRPATRPASGTAPASSSRAPTSSTG